MFSRDKNIHLLRRRIVALLLIFSTLVNLSSAAVPYVPCRNPTAGARAKFYEYPLGDTVSYNNLDFILGGYTKNKYIGELFGFKNISWDSGWPAAVSPYGFKRAPITNFLMAVTAYYRAPQTGRYRVSLKADNFAAFFVGKNSVSDYCSFYHYNFTANELVASNEGVNAVTKSVYLKKGMYYPVLVIYVNSKERGILSVNMIRPDGKVDAGITENLYVMPEYSGWVTPVTFRTRYATSTAASLPGLTAPTTVSTLSSMVWINNNDGFVQVVYVVDEPLSATTPATTSDISVPTTSSYTTLGTSSTDSSTTADVFVPSSSIYSTPVTSSIDSSTTADVSVPSSSVYSTPVTSSIDSSTTADVSVPSSSVYSTPVTSSTDSSTTADVSVPSSSIYSTPVTSSIGSSTTTNVSMPITSSYTTLVTGSVVPSSTTGGSIPRTSTYTTVITGTIASASPEVVFTLGVEVEVRY